MWKGEKKKTKNEKKTKTKTKNGEGRKTIGTFVEREALIFGRGKKGENNGCRGIYFGKAKPSFIRADA